MDSRKKYEELKEEGKLPKGKTPLSASEREFVDKLQCTHARREGESWRLNNNCRYPDCPSPNRGLVWKGLTKDTFEMADKALKKLK